MRFISFLLTYLISISILACPPPEHLFQVMQGNWAGRGTKETHTSDVPVYMEAFTNSTIQNGHLIVSEVQKIFKDSDNPTTHKFDYWIRPTQGACNGQFRTYHFGSGPLNSSPKFSGKYNGRTLVSVEDINSQLMYATITEFSDYEANVIGQLIQDDRVVMRQEVRYHKMD